VTLAEVAVRVRNGLAEQARDHEIRDWTIRQFEADPDFTLREKVEKLAEYADNLIARDQAGRNPSEPHAIEWCPECRAYNDMTRRLRELLPEEGR
jgi:hypothetical protein